MKLTDVGYFSVSGYFMKQLLNTIISIVFLLAFNVSYGQTNASLKAQAQKVISSLKKQNDYPSGGKDTLIDLNGDGHKDILIEFYALAGTGLKNGISVYLYNYYKRKFENCEQLNHLANPTFYFNKRIVVGYYLGGSGTATKLKWHGLRLDTLEQIDIDVITMNNEFKGFKLVTHDYLTKKKTTKTSKLMYLPKEYKYMEYESIIKTSSR